LLNFIALVDGARGDREIMPRRDAGAVCAGGDSENTGRFDRKKLAWMNGEYIRKATLDRLADAVASYCAVAETP